MNGETITLIRRVQTGRDQGNNPIWEETPEDVDDVLVGPPSGSDATDTSRPEGIGVDLTLYFPRTYRGGSLRGCLVLIRGETTPYRVIGDPMPVDGGMSPTRWNMTVPVTRSEG